MDNFTYYHYIIFQKYPQCYFVKSPPVPFPQGMTQNLSKEESAGCWNSSVFTDTSWGCKSCPYNRYPTNNIPTLGLAHLPMALYTMPSTIIGYRTLIRLNDMFSMLKLCFATLENAVLWYNESALLRVPSSGLTLSSCKHTDVHLVVCCTHTG